MEPPARVSRYVLVDYYSMYVQCSTYLGSAGQAIYQYTL